jgi:hypothetical protein
MTHGLLDVLGILQLHHGFMEPNQLLHFDPAPLAGINEV